MIEPATRSPTNESLDALRESSLTDVFPGLRIPPGQRNRPQTLHNTIAVSMLSDGPAVLMFYGRRFDVPPVPYTIGLELDSVQRQLRQLLVDATGGDYLGDPAEFDRIRRNAYDRAIALFGRLVRGHGPIHRLVLRLFRINPFVDATEQDVAQLFGFFLACRRRSGVQSR